LNLPLFLFCGLLAILVVLLVWALRGPRRLRKPGANLTLLEETGKRHVNFMPQIRQALAKTDSLYLSRKAPALVARRVRQERRRIVLVYLSAVREDFHNLLRMASVNRPFASTDMVCPRFDSNHTPSRCVEVHGCCGVRNNRVYHDRTRSPTVHRLTAIFE